MSVTITDPPNNSVFPDPGSNDWIATVTINSADAVDGVLLDYNPNSNGAYPSTGPSVSGPDSNGLYTWEVPFPHNGIAKGNPLVIYCYDAEINGDGTSVADQASQDG